MTVPARRGITDASTGTAYLHLMGIIMSPMSKSDEKYMLAVFRLCFTHQQSLTIMFQEARQDQPASLSLLHDVHLRSTYLSSHALALSACLWFSFSKSV